MIQVFTNRAFGSPSVHARLWCLSLCFLSGLEKVLSCLNISSLQQLKNPTQQGTMAAGIFTSAVEQLNDLIRSLLDGFHGYECDYKDHGAFNLAFPSLTRAIQFAVVAQKRAMDLPYPNELLEIAGCKEVRG